MNGTCNHCHAQGHVTRLLEVESIVMHGLNVYKVTKIVDDQLCYDCIEEICDDIAQQSLNRGT